MIVMKRCQKAYLADDGAQLPKNRSLAPHQGRPPAACSQMVFLFF